MCRREALGFDSYLHHRPRGFICGQHCSSVDALCAVHRATLQHQRCGRLGAAVAVGMGNTLGPGETCRRCMLISRGGATRGLTGVQRGKRRGPRCGVRAPAMQRHSISRGRSRLWPSGLQYNARHMQIAWPSISLCTAILARRCSVICRRQLTQKTHARKAHNCLVP